MPEQQETLRAEAAPNAVRVVTVDFRYGAFALVQTSSDGRRVMCSLATTGPLNASLYLTPAEARALGEALIQQAGGEA